MAGPKKTLKSQTKAVEQQKKLTIKKSRRATNKGTKLETSSSEEELPSYISNITIRQSKADWIQCVACNGWLHETCTLFKKICNYCGEKKN